MDFKQPVLQQESHRHYDAVVSSYLQAKKMTTSDHQQHSGVFPAVNSSVPSSTTTDDNELASSGGGNVNSCPPSKRKHIQQQQQQQQQQDIKQLMTETKKPRTTHQPTAGKQSIGIQYKPEPIVQNQSRTASFSPPPEQNESIKPYPEVSINDLPPEVVELIASKTNSGHATCQLRLVNKRFREVIDSAPWFKLPKVEYEIITVTAQRGLEVILEKGILDATVDPAEIAALEKEVADSMPPTALNEEQEERTESGDQEKAADPSMIPNNPAADETAENTEDDNSTAVQTDAAPSNKTVGVGNSTAMKQQGDGGNSNQSDSNSAAAGGGEDGKSSSSSNGIGNKRKSPGDGISGGGNDDEKTDSSKHYVTIRNGEPARLILPKQKRESLQRLKLGNTLKITDRLSQKEMGKLMNYFRHINAKKLVLQSLSGKGLLTMLMIFRRLCLRTETLVLDFCNFNGLKKQLIFDFFKPRKNKLHELQLSSCRDMGTSFSPEEFWEAMGTLEGKYPTIRLKDHYSNSPWMDKLATLILESDRPPWILDIDGVSPPQESVHRRLLHWYAQDPILRPAMKQYNKHYNKTDNSGTNNNDNNGNKPNDDGSSRADGRNRSQSKSKSLKNQRRRQRTAYQQQQQQQQQQESEASTSQASGGHDQPQQEAAEDGGDNNNDAAAPPRRIVNKRKRKIPKRKSNFIIKIDNCRGIRLGRFWNETQKFVLEPNNIMIQPELCKVLEPCFDGRSRYSTHRNRMVLKRPDGARFSIYLQR